MKPLARAGRNLMLKTAGEVLARLSSFILVIFAARILGAGQYGRYSFAASFAALALVGMDLGLNTLFVRDGARNPGQVGSYAGTLLLLKTGLALLVLAGVFAYLRLSGEGLGNIALVLAVAVSQVLWGIVEYCVAGLNSLERMDQEAMIRILGRLAALFAAGALLLAGFGLWGMVWGLVIAYALGAALGLRVLWRHARFSIQLNAAFLGYLAREALPLALTNIFVLVYFRVDIVMLEALGRPFDEIGWYASGVRLVDAVGTTATLVSLSMLPVLASLAVRDHQAMVKLYIQGQRLLTMIGIPAAVGLWAVRGPVVELVYGPEFGPAARSLAWQAPALAFLFVTFIQLNTLIVLGLQNRAALVTGLCALVNVALNLAFIPRWGYEGAAAATLVTNVSLFGMCAVIIHKRLGPTGLGSLAARPALASAVMGAALYFTHSLPLPVIVGSAALVYTAVLMASGGLTVPEAKELMGMVLRKKQ